MRLTANVQMNEFAFVSSIIKNNLVIRIPVKELIYKMFWLAFR